MQTPLGQANLFKIWQKKKGWIDPTLELEDDCLRLIL
jgi:hypothetical protein